LRRDDSRLLVRSAARQAERVARGLPASPLKVTVTASGDLDPALRFFTAGDAERLVYAPTSAMPRLRALPAGVADAGEPPDFGAVLDDLAARGVGRLLVEGGSAVHTAFLTRDLADELQLAVAPFFVGDARAPRFVRDGAFAHDPGRPMTLAEARPI